MTETLTREIAEGITVTVRRPTVWSATLWRSLNERMEAEMLAYGETIAQRWLWYIICASNTVSVAGIDWQPPGVFATPEQVRDNFEVWLRAIPDVDAIAAWIVAINEVSGALVPEELSPTGISDEVAEDDPKESGG